MPAAEAQAVLLPGITGPFPGLRPFESDEETIFRGRRNQTDELLRRLAGHRFLAVVGTSGSGKSSLVRAGLLPALDRGYLTGATSRWRIAVMRPGMAPIENLAEALRGSGAQQAAIEGADALTLRSSSLGLVEAVRSAKLADGESLLVVADQFEELFRYSRRISAHDGGGEAARFVNLLLTAARRPDAPVYVVLTMRSDFLGDCAQFPGLPEVLSESQYLIPRLAREQRRQAIVEPLRLFGATMTPQLIEQLLNDSGDEPSDLAPADPALGSRYRGGAPDPLPVLQHALLRTWLEWKALPQDKTGEPIDLPQYQSAGRMEAALNQHAEGLFKEELDDEGRRWAERIFRCLTTTELGRPIRRPTPLADLATIIGSKDGDRKKVDQVLDLFRRRDNSLVQLNKDGSVDIAHESLIWKWKRLSGWVADEAASADLYRDLIKDATGRATWGEPKLSSALAVRDRNAWNADWALQYSEDRFQDVQTFLARSQKAVRNQRWLRWFGAGAAVAVMILAVVAYYSMLRTRQKEKELATVQIAQGSLAREQETLRGQLKGLNADKGATQADRERIAKEKAALQEQLSKSQQDSQKLAAQAQQTSADLLVTMQNLEDQLAAAQRDRNDAVKARQDAETKSAQLAKNLATAQDERDTAIKSQQDSQKLAAQAQQSSTDLLANMKTLASQLAAAKQVNGKLSGTVEDSNGKPVSGARIMLGLMDSTTEGELTTTSRAGTFSFPSLRPIYYELTVEAPGFKKLLMGVKVDPASESSLPPIRLEGGRREAPEVANKAADTPTQTKKTMTNPKDGLIYVWIPPGRFTMGCSPGDKECKGDETRSHTEQIANGFWLSQTEVTQAAWKRVKGNNPSFSFGDQLPVELVDWNQANDYCNAIGGRLPAEKEWEYAARAGTLDARYGELDAVGWSQRTSRGKTHPVRLKQANAFGLYDMLGNVREWTDTNFDISRKVARGGS